MTFDAQEDSIQDGQPFELYRFARQSEITNYTSSEDDLQWQGTIYTSVQISRSSFRDDRNTRKNVLELTLPAGDPLVLPFKETPPDGTTTLTVLRAHRNDGAEETELWFKGRITGIKFTKRGATAVLTVRDLSSGLARSVPRFGFQGLCNHVLYDNSCQVDRQSFRFDGTVIDATGSTITVQNVSTQGADWAVGGFVQFGPDPGDGLRLVLAQSGDQLTLLTPFSQDLGGQEVSVFAGCAHDITTCNAKFSNVLNYGGFAFVPELNPFSDGLDV